MFISEHSVHPSISATTEAPCSRIAWIPSHIVEILDVLDKIGPTSLSELRRATGLTPQIARKRLAWCATHNLLEPTTGRNRYVLDLSAGGVVVLRAMQRLQVKLEYARKVPQ